MMWRLLANNMGTRHSTERVSVHAARPASDSLTNLIQIVADVDLPKDNEIYERLLRRKGRGFALYIPQPNRRLPIAYRRVGICIGDVGVITPDGGFNFLFNICVPHDDPANPSILPQGFSPLQPALTDVDVVEFSQYSPGSYLASTSIEKKESDSNVKCVTQNQLRCS